MSIAKRTTAMILTLLILFSSFSAYADWAADVAELENPPTDFVLVYDCSGSLYYTDKEGLCGSACRSFIDIQPAENARVGVIAMGPTTSNPFKFGSKFNVDESSAKHIEELIPLGYMNSTTTKENYKKTVQDSIDKNKTRGGSADSSLTPIGSAVAAAVEMLEREGSTDGNASIIIVSDCFLESKSKDEFEVLKAACSEADGHDWGVYAIGLTYSFSDYDIELATQAKNASDKVLQCVETYNNAVDKEIGQVFRCKSENDVFKALTGVIGASVNEVFPPCDCEFDVEPLTSEVYICAFGPNINSLTITPPNNEMDIVVSGRDIDEKQIVANVENMYTTVRLICPKAGQWNLHIEGESGVRVQISYGSLYEYGLKMIAEGARDNYLEVLRNQKITVNTCLAYQDIELHNDSFYKEHCSSSDVQLRVLDGNSNIVMERDMQASDNGYSCTIESGTLKTGEYRLQTVLKNSMFRTGIRISNSVYVSLINKPVELNPDAPKELKFKGYSNCPIGETIDLTKLFINPDNDIIEYTVTAIEDRDLKFKTDVSPEGYMTITSPNAEGKYTLSISAADGDMSTPVVYDKISLNLENRKIDKKRIPSLEIWTDKYLFQKKEVGPFPIDLNDYYEDPDGADVNYTVTVEDESVLTVDRNGTVLVLNPVTEGKSELHITANDGLSQVESNVKVSVISGKASFWRHNWLKIVIAAAILVFVIIIIIILFKNKIVHGLWDIEFDINGNNETINDISISGNTLVGRKSKFLLYDMLLEIAQYMNNPSWQTDLPQYFQANGASQIQLTGMIFSKGFIVNKIPKDNDIKLYNNGRHITKKTKVSVSGSQFNLIINDLVGSTLTVTLTLH